MLSRFSHVWLFVTLWTVACEAPLSLGFSRQEYWSVLPYPPPGESSWPRDQTCVSCIAGRFFIYWVTWEALCGIQFSSVAQSCLTLYDPMICSTPGLPVHHQLLEFNYRCSNLLLSHITVQFSQYHLLRRLPFLHYIFLSTSL